MVALSEWQSCLPPLASFERCHDRDESANSQCHACENSCHCIKVLHPLLEKIQRVEKSMCKCRVEVNLKYARDNSQSGIDKPDIIQLDKFFGEAHSL
jgi:hypothetical protein